MKYNDRLLRHELKYIISYNDYILLKSRLSPFMEQDKNSSDSGYYIRSVYFDDIYNSAYTEKEAGINRRRKIRVRIYNGSDSIIKLEIKDKFGEYISKNSVAISKEQYYRILQGDIDFMLTENSRVLREVFIAFRTRLMHPSVIVDYEREAFIRDEGNVRITFDKDLRAAVGGFDIFEDTLETLPAIDEGYMILEVKYDGYLPGNVRRLLSGLNRWRTSASKFVMCKQASALYYRKDVPYESAII